MKAGMSPINSPRSQLTNQHQASHDMASPSKTGALGSAADPMKVDQARIPEASSLMLNLMLSDTILNVFRDHNFDSCTICVCSNEGNIRGRDAAPYLPNFSGDDDITCICGFSALMNRYVKNLRTKVINTITYSWGKKNRTKRHIWSKTTLITSGVGGAGVDPPPRKMSTFF